LGTLLINAAAAASSETPTMNTPGTPRPSGRQRKWLLIILAVFVGIFFVTLFYPW